MGVVEKSLGSFIYKGAWLFFHVLLTLKNEGNLVGILNCDIYDFYHIEE
ncbi:conserved hypothetical protein [Listeria marthii FSL S4-120]|uniref:Uncharacterized protein n=1 Tax=Listeria marthii FSL S4-120 TaxID=702457 RepID=A0ABP2JYZ7_9LIST|nr:conserved hypothetical protein [Listeria marthii FSL S4-120]